MEPDKNFGGPDDVEATRKKKGAGEGGGLFSSQTLVDASPLVHRCRALFQSPDEGAHILAFVWDASKLPHGLIKGAKVMKESIKVTLFLQSLSHTHTHRICMLIPLEVL